MDVLFPLLLKIVGVLILVLLNGFFVAAEFALVKVRDTQLSPLIAEGSRAARVTRRVLANLDASLSACQLGITLASLGLGWVGEPVFAALLTPVLDLLQIESETLRHSISFFVGFSVLTFLHISAGEQAPKWLAIQKPLPTSLWVARPLSWFHRASWPFIWVLNRASLQLLRWLGLQPTEEGEHAHSEEELRLLFSSAQKRAGGTALGHDVVLNAMDLGRREAREVMRPRHEMVVLDTASNIAECLDVAEQTRFSRFPVCEDGDLDRALGVVHVKDLFSARLKVRSAAELKPYLRKIIYVPPTARLEKVLQLFLEQKLHLGIVVDEYGGTSGMITLENILEELVGQIQDEFDQEKPRIVQLNESTWELDGGLPLHELGELVGETLEDDLIATIGGWITQLLGGFPKQGDLVKREGYDLRVEAMDGMRVARVRLKRWSDIEGPEAAPPS
jgi:CBS domain containing-hemolysin-like protein